MEINFVHVISAFFVLFAVIDIVGSIPIIIDLKTKYGKLESGKATIVAFSLMFMFLFFGENLLGLFGVDVSSFAIAGSFVLFFLAMEMVLGVEFFKNDSAQGYSIVPLAFPLIAGAGSITSLLSLKAEFTTIEIGIALVMNMIVVYAVLKLTKHIERIIGQTGIMILRKFFGIVLLAISIRLFMSNVADSLKLLFPGLIN